MFVSLCPALSDTQATLRRFELDPTSPEYESLTEGEQTTVGDNAIEEDGCDYEILSSAL